MIKKAIFPGSFDPLHSGHINIIKRASKLFDILYVAVSFNSAKKQDNLDIRFKKVDTKIKTLKLKNVKTVKNKTLTVKKAKELGCKYIIRSVRDLKDYKYEMMIAQNNHKLNKNVETILFFAEKDLQKVNSTSLRLEVEKIKKLGKK
ncbi:MAG: pantetheine-phosphate adenylyltransferase [Clostridia bacterium]|nr:pantetheine-phosphate adenylyltransferase [Clostridia bacterium]